MYENSVKIQLLRMPAFIPLHSWKRSASGVALGRRTLVRPYRLLGRGSVREEPGKGITDVQLVFVLVKSELLLWTFSMFVHDRGCSSVLNSKLLNIPLLRTASGQRSSECRATNELQTALKLSEPPFFLRGSWACETREHVKITPREKRRCIPQEKWGTTRSLIRESFPLVGWFSRALAFRTLYYPWGKIGDHS